MTRSPLQWLAWLAATVAFALSIPTAVGQGTITFGTQSTRWSGTAYIEAGMGINVVVPNPNEPYHDGMVITPGFANEAQNPTPYMFFLRQNSPDNYVALSLTNGSAFGLTAVQLADPYNPSLSPLPIMFKGYKADGSSVTNTFTTPGGGATTFQNYTFTAAFSGGLTSVDILAPRWAMDNLAFAIPEPSAACLLFTGGLFVYARFRKKH